MNIPPSLSILLGARLLQPCGLEAGAVALQMRIALHISIPSPIPARRSRQSLTDSLFWTATLNPPLRYRSSHNAAARWPKPKRWVGTQVFTDGYQ
jgi:hypothetical protein